jgi:hypothetical protein
MVPMTAPIQTPTADRVKAACEKFDLDHDLAEQSLAELFRQYPRNDDHRHVLLKVLAVNSLYHTSIFAIETVARHIHANAKEIDSALAAGSPEVVNQIAKVTIQGRKYNFFSFATKYSSWHNPLAYPIYDARVDHYLCVLQQQSPFSGFHHADLWDYHKFRKVMIAFRDTHKLSAFTFKEIDKFLWLEGAPPPSATPNPQHMGPGAFDFYPTEELTT